MGRIQGKFWRRCHVNLTMYWIWDVRAKGNQKRVFGLSLIFRTDGMPATKMGRVRDLGVRQGGNQEFGMLGWICPEDQQTEISGRWLTILFGFQRRSRSVNLGDNSSRPPSRPLRFIKKLPVTVNLKRQEFRGPVLFLLRCSLDKGTHIRGYCQTHNKHYIC